jgi:hypothetical protein
VKERIAFELDHYDRHSVLQSTVETRPWTWRVNLLGGGRLHDLAARMDALPKLRDFWEEKNWEHGEGFLVAQAANPKPAPWLTGKPYLPPGAFGEEGIDKKRITVVEEKEFDRPRKPTRYAPPLVLIKEVETLPCAFWNEGFLAYSGRIVGVHAPPAEVSELRGFYKQFSENRTVLRAFCAMFGTEAISSKATAILKRDIDVLPWPRTKRDWALSWWERALCEDVVEFAADFVRLGQNSRLLREQVDDRRLQQFADTYVRMLGSVYTNLKASHFGLLDGLAFQAFCFGEAPDLGWPDDWSETLHKVIYQEHGDALRTVRILRFYNRNMIILVKPDRLRYWIPTTAIRDADETLRDLHRQGY